VAIQEGPTPAAASAERQRRIVVVGASLGGLRAAEQLRGAGWVGGIVVVGDEPHMPYNRPPLSKASLASPGSPGEALAALAFRPRRSATDVVWRLGSPAVAADLAAGTITTAAGEQLAFDGLVAATGLRPARVPVPGPLTGRHVVRALKDTLRLHAELVPGARVVVVGAGFIGCEVAATALGLGCDVTLVEGSGGPMERSVGALLSAGVRELLRSRGVACLPGVRVTEFLSGADGAHDGARCAGVRLTDGSVVAADVIVEAVGSEANVEWLEGNGLDLSDGVLCDASMRALGPDGVAAGGRVVAVGDIARYPDGITGGPARRIEHWATPTDTAKIAAPALVAALRGAEVPVADAPLPSFWTDLFGLRIQGVGNPGRADETEVLEGDPARPSDGVALAYRRSGRLVGVVTAAVPADRHLRYRQAVLDELRSVPA
jgi:NADPH-dependent 2,4-dienoyl-CoA reductase/sulfur reductase-like enzyme